MPCTCTIKCIETKQSIAEWLNDMIDMVSLS